jgi:hypothetical protein
MTPALLMLAGCCLGASLITIVFFNSRAVPQKGPLTP